MRNGIVSAEEIMRRVKASGGDIRGTREAKANKKAIDYIPTRRAGHSQTREELVEDYMGYLRARDTYMYGAVEPEMVEEYETLLRQRAVRAAREHYREDSRGRK